MFNHGLDGPAPLKKKMPKNYPKVWKRQSTQKVKSTIKGIFGFKLKEFKLPLVLYL